METEGDAPEGTRRTDEEPGDRHTGHLEVEHVDTRGVQPGHHCPLQHARRAARVARGDHCGALAQRRAIRHRHAHRHLRGDVDVGQALHAFAAEQTARALALPHDRTVHDRAVLDGLERIDLHIAGDDRVGADEHFVAHHGAFVDAHIGADTRAAPDDCPAHLRAGADVHVVVHHRPVDLGISQQSDVRAEHGVLAHPAAGLDRTPGADHARSLHLGIGRHLGPLPQPHSVVHPEPGDVDRHLLVEDVFVGRQVRLERADVFPVTLHHRTEQRLAGLEQRGEHLTGEVDAAASRDEVEDRRFEHIDAGVDGVAEDLPPRRFFEESLDRAIVAGDDDAELERIVDGSEADGGHRMVLAMELEHLGEIDVGEHITRDDQERVVEVLACIAHAASGAQRHGLVGIADGDTELAAVAEVGLDVIGQERNRDHDLVEAVPGEQIDDVLHHRPVGDRQHRLGGVRRERTQTRPLTAGHDDSLHRNSLRGSGTGAAIIDVRRAPRALTEDCRGWWARRRGPSSS